MSQIYITALVILLAQLASMFGLNFGQEQLLTVATFIVTIVGSAWIMFRRKQQGDINLAGIKK